MGFEKTVILNLFPGWAAKRAEHRKKYRKYEAVQTTHQRNPKRDSRSADGTNDGAVKGLREQARYLEENYDLAKGAINAVVNNVVGPQLLPEPKVREKNGRDAKKINKVISELWADWSKSPEVTGELNFNEVARLVCRAWVRDGECFAKHIMGAPKGLVLASAVPYTIELIESDFCPMSLDDKDKNIVQGIEKDSWGKPVRFHFFDEHPGDAYFYSLKTQAVDASIVSHIKHTTRFRQTRGVSAFAPVFTRLYDVKDYEESERIAARLTAAIGLAFVNDGDGATPFDNNEDADGVRHYDGFEPGMVFDNLPHGVRPEIIESKRPNSLAIPFREAMLKAVASGFGVSYSTIAKDYSGTFSSQRQELVESYQSYRVMRNAFVSMFVQPVYERFIQMCLVQGLIVPNVRTDMTSIFDVHFEGSQMPWIDPLKEANANIALVEAKLKTRAQVLREMGMNPDQVMQQLEKEAEMEFLQPKESPQPEEDDPENEDEKEAADERLFL